MESAEGKLTLSAEDLRRGIADMPENVGARRVMWAYALLMILAGLGAGLVVEASLLLRGLWIAFGVTLIVYGQFRSRSAGEKLLASLKDGERQVSYCFDAEGVNIRTSVSEVSLRYAALRRQFEISTAFLLYTQERMAQIVPKRAFDTAQIEHIRQWLAAAVQDAPRPKRFLRLFVIWAVLIVSFLTIWSMLQLPN